MSKMPLTRARVQPVTSRPAMRSSPCVAAAAVAAALPPQQRRTLRWADIGDGSEEDAEEDCVPPAPAVAVDDSYWEAPLTALEDSKDGLNLQLAGCVHLRTAPQDFTFLIGSEASERSRRSSDHSRHSSAQFEDGASSTASTSAPWQPNVHAPEFIPTLSMSCPLVEIRPFVTRQPTVLETPTPEKGRAPSVGPGGEKRKRGGGRKRRPSSLPAPSQKRTKSEEREEEEELAAQLEAKPHELVKPQPEVQHVTALPEASEDDWLRREEMRQKSVDTVKKFPEYQWYEGAKWREAREPDEPSTPDPRDRTISKRRWKYLTTQWRLALKQRFLEEGHGIEGASAFNGDDSQVQEPTI